MDFDSLLSVPIKASMLLLPWAHCHNLGLIFGATENERSAGAPSEHTFALQFEGHRCFRHVHVCVQVAPSSQSAPCHRRRPASKLGQHPRLLQSQRWPQAALQHCREPCRSPSRPGTGSRRLQTHK